MISLFCFSRIVNGESFESHLFDRRTEWIKVSVSLPRFIHFHISGCSFFFYPCFDSTYALIESRFVAIPTEWQIKSILLIEKKRRGNISWINLNRKNGPIRFLEQTVVTISSLCGRFFLYFLNRQLKNSGWFSNHKRDGKSK